MRLWGYFLKREGVAEGLTPEQLYKLAEITPKEQGAFIEEFSRNYRSLVRSRLLVQKGCASLLDAMKRGVGISEKEIKLAVNYDLILTDVQEAIKRKLERNGKEEKDKTIEGFKK